ncbi:MAG: DUF169 domain-containing protein [Thermodesulfobacteriota bacterium]
MIDLSQVSAKLDQYVKPIDYPVALRMLRGFEPEQLRREQPKAKIPHLDLGKKVLVCQAMAMARKYGWDLILTKQDIPCGTGLVALGLVRMTKSMLAGEDPVAPYNQSQEARARRMRQLPCFAFGEYEALQVAPLHRARFEPDAVVIYANSAQVMRLVQGALFFEGGSLSSNSAGGQGCAQYITRTIQDNQCRYVLPGNGDRIFGLAGDGQMIFAMPRDKIESVVQGLELSHQGGQRLPIPCYLNYEAELPKEYRGLADKLLRASEAGGEEG